MDEAPSRVPLRMIAATALAAGLTPLNSTMISVALRPIGSTFGTGTAELTRALVTSYLVTSIVMQAPGGKIGDGLGHRRTLALGQIAFGLGAALALLAPSVGWLVAARIAMGAAGALIVPSAMALLRTELPMELRGRAFGAFGATMSFAAAIGPPLGGQLTSAFGWRAVFSVNLVLLPISALLAGGGSKARRAVPKAEVRRFDLLGTVLLAALLSSFVLGVGRGGALNLTLLALVPLFGAALAVVERRQVAPVLDLSVMRIPAFLGGSLLIALQNLAMYALLFELPAVCGIVLRANASQTGRLLIALMAPMVLVSPVAGRLADAFGARKVALVGTSSALAGALVLWATPMTSLWAQLPGLAVFGTGLALSTPPAQSAAMSAVPAPRSGTGAGMMATLRYLGGVVGTLVLGIVLVSATDAVTARAAHRVALTTFAVSLALAVGCAGMLPGRRASGSQPA